MIFGTFDAGHLGMLTLRCLSLILFLSVTSNSWAVITPVAVTGDAVPGLPGAQYASFGYAQMNADAQGVYAATLQTGPGGITTSNDKVLISFNGNLTLNAQTGSGNVAGAVGTNYANFQEFKIADSGDVLVKATLVETGDVNHLNKQGYWRFSGSAGSLITRTGTSVVPGISAGEYLDLGARVGTSHTSNFAFLGRLETDNGVSSNDDFGIWLFQGASGTLIARESGSAASVVGGLFLSFGFPAVNSSNEVAFRANMKTGGSITMANRLGLWVYNEGQGELIARAGSAEVPGSTSDFTAFDDPVINDAGDVVFRGSLATGQQGLWRYSGNTGENLAITNAVGIPGLPSASFTTLGPALLTDSGQVVTLGTLAIGLNGVTTNNDTGLWMFGKGGVSQLLTREGDGGVAGIAGASFASFERIAPIDDTGIYMNATLQAGGLVDESNDEGIWRIPFDGTPELILRKGDTLAGRTVANLWLPAGEFDDVPLKGISNESGELLFHASFTNGDVGLFLYSPSNITEFADADFDQDGDVDGSDLTRWQSAYGPSAAADADGDGDTDGRDFLAWQRQYTGPGTLGQIQSVPEPNVWALLGLAAFCVSVRPRA